MREKLLRQKVQARLKRKRRIRANISGTAQKPRVSIFRSNRFIYAQAIDDQNGVTLAGLDGSKDKFPSSKEGALKAAQSFAKTLAEHKIEEIVFDRNGYIYHGVVAAFADELRNNAIKF